MESYCFLPFENGSVYRTIPKTEIHSEVASKCQSRSLGCIPSVAYCVLKDGEGLLKPCDWHSSVKQGTIPGSGVGLCKQFPWDCDTFICEARSHYKAD